MHPLVSSLLEFGTVVMSVQFLARMMLILSFFSIALMFIRRWRQPAELVTSVAIQKNLPKLSAVKWIPQVLFLATMLSLNCWLAQPVIPVYNETRTLDTRDIFIAVDKSGSMDGLIIDEEGEAHGKRIEAATKALKFFVEKRQGDRIGLAVFDDKTYMHWPMTDDLRIILKKADLIPQYTGGGTNFDSITGPIQAAIDHWKEYGKARTKVLIMISDGEAPISDDRMNELVEQMRALNGKIYLLGVGESWTDPAKADSSQTEAIKKLLATLGGKVFAVANAEQMLDAVATIDVLEKSNVQVEVTTTFRDVSRYFGLASCLFLFLFIVSVAFTRERA